MRSSLLALIFTVACAANSLGERTDGGGRECIDSRDCPTGATCEGGICVAPDERRECETAADCPPEYTCEDRGAVRICIPPDVTPTMDCGDCPFPNECRDGVCVAPDETGDVCEFDPECGEDHLCIAGRCTWDPRIPRTCLDGEMCPDGLMCAMDGRCVCAETADCPVGTVCAEDGSCVPEDGGCVAGDECPAGSLCDRGMCVPDAACDVVHPDLSTDPIWNVSSVYNFREALPGWLDGFLATVAGPFRFLAGDSDDPDLGLPGFVEDAIGAAIRSWAEDNLPPWALDAMGAIADLNDILSTWLVEERMRLTPAGRDAYVGSNEWTQVSFEYRGMRMVGAPGDILGWSYTPEDYEAQAVCGTLNIARHDVQVGIGAIIAWVADTVVYESSDGRYRDLEDMARSLQMPLCDQAYTLAEGIWSGAGGLARSWCNSTVGGLIDEMLRAIEEALLELDLVKLKGYAVIVDGNRLEPGVWEGSLIGGDFSGTWSARR